MAEVVKMPKMSDTMTEGVMAKWHKKVGDKVKSGDVLAEVETDKATMDLESYWDGVMLYIGVEEVNVPDIGGDEVEVTEVMVKVGDKVEAEQSLITVEGDKDSMEVPPPLPPCLERLI